ncbi:hypothetical protein TTHERM_00772010 (macronuclear) [Tetrahymena thermophila SB210]|uniref:Uncharacterized protein n=1 Tax=Tetrahymena thermophila (strain SB210) TaxID=312017 RepID=Q23AP7_TETTS|nr:hypothetical protein TTHERM_00772010 [Tetrahymena thermophila SB210]EAR93645.2 hypothetical protein TTHERM_00772010 [Tetrahymena thermophila SB210]|eukprot:XP_001013890.2 hypothetical protein TTHERM_00772010 [Tetrahymena thermophila SB210]
MANQSQSNSDELALQQINQANEQLEELQNQIKSRKALLEALGGESKFDEEKYLILIKTLENSMQEKEQLAQKQQETIDHQIQLLDEKDQLLNTIQIELQSLKEASAKQVESLQQADQQINQLKLEKESINQNLLDLQKENTDKEKNIKEQEEQLQSLQKKYNEAVEAKNRRQSIEKSISSTKLKSKPSMAQKSQYEIMLDKEQDKGIISDLQQRIQELEKQNFQLKEQTGFQKIKIEQYESSEEIVSIKKLLDEKGEKNKQLQEKIIELESQIAKTLAGDEEQGGDQKVKQIEQELKIVLELEQKKNEEFCNQIDIMNQKNSLLVQEIKMLNENMSFMQKNQNELAEQKDLQINQMMLRLSQLEQALQDKQNEIELLQNESEEKLKKIPQLSSLVQELNNQVQALNQQIEEEKQKHIKNDQEYQNKIQNLSHNYENKIQNLQESYTKMKNQLIEERNTHKSKQEDFDHQLLEKELEIQNLKSEVEVMEKIKNQQSTLITNYRKTIQETKEQIDQKISELDETKFIKEQQDQDLEELREQNNQKENKLKQLAAKMRQIQDKLSQKEDESINFNKIKMMFYNDNERLKTNLVKAQKQLQEYQKKILPQIKKSQEEKDNEVKMVRDMLKSQQTLLRVKENDIIRMKQKISKLEALIDESSNINDNKFHQNNSVFSNRKGENNNINLPPLNDENQVSPLTSIEQIRKQNLKNYQNRILEQQRNVQLFGKNQLKHSSLPSSYANQNIFQFQQNPIGQHSVQNKKTMLNQNPSGNWIPFDEKTIQEGIEDIINQQKKVELQKKLQQGFGLPEKQTVEDDQRWTPVSSNNGRAPSNYSLNNQNMQNDSLLMKKKNYNSVFDLAATKDDIKNAHPNPQFSLSPVRVKIPSMSKKGGNYKIIHPEEQNQEQKTSKFEQIDNSSTDKTIDNTHEKQRTAEENSKQQSHTENNSVSQAEDTHKDEEEDQEIEEENEQEYNNQDEEQDDDDDKEKDNLSNNEEDDEDKQEEEEEQNDENDQD